MIYFVSNGGVAVCESTCFAEPILIFSKGAIINLYQVLMDRRLPFSLVATSADRFKVSPDVLTEELCVHAEQKDIE